MRGQAGAGLGGDCETHRAPVGSDDLDSAFTVAGQKTALGGVRVCDPNRGPLQKLCQEGRYLDWSPLGSFCIFLPSVTNEV